MRQYFYLVCRSLDEGTKPLKCFLQKSDAVKYGQRLTDNEDDVNVSYDLYRQLIARTNTFEYVKTFFKHEVQDNQNNGLEPFNWIVYQNSED